MGRKHRIYACLQDNEDWPEANSLALSEKDAAFYSRMRSAILQYRGGASASDVEKSTGITRSHLTYWLERCSSLDQDNRPLRWLALARHQRLGARTDNIQKVNRESPVSGVLLALFRIYSTLFAKLARLVLENKPPGSERAVKRMGWPEKHEYFLQILSDLNHRPPAWPFNSPDKGFLALKTWGKKLISKRDQQESLAAESRRGEDSWWRRLLPTSRCFAIVECDGHAIDINWKVSFESPNGEGHVTVKVTRLWLLALIENVSSAVVGYSIAYGKNYSAADLCRAVRCSLVPWKPRNLQVSTITYRAGECLPNALMPELAYVCFDQLWLDNAWAHLAKLFTSTLTRVVSAIPVFGPRAAPNVRPRIEGLFDLLEEAGIHPTSGTTGSHPRDPRRANAKDEALLLDDELVLDLIDILICRYNASNRPGSTISRLEVLRRVVEREATILRRIPISRRENLLSYDTFEVGKIGMDKRKPVLRWQNARYFGGGLYSEPELIGKEVLVMGNSLDGRFVEAILIGNGKTLGILEVEQRWLQTPHSLMARSEIRRMMTNEPFLRSAADIPKAFREHLQNKKKLNAKEARLLARLAIEQASASAAHAAKTGEAGDEADSSSRPAPTRRPNNDTEPQAPAKSPAPEIGDRRNAHNRNALDEMLRSIGSIYREGDS
jgi:hypothetical protein